MIQDIGKFRYHNEYRKTAPVSDSKVLCYRNRELLLYYQDQQISFPAYGELQRHLPELADKYTYLFSIDETSYYLFPAPDEKRLPGTVWEDIRILRTASPREEAFAGITGHQLYDWYDSRKYCPRCGKPLIHDERERMMRCTSCGQQEYPKISPAVIVGVTHGDRLLLTKYAGRDFKKYALIAGFAEIGETIEETVQREVMEEVGLKVKNLRYYKSQPWSFSGTLLMGFFAELDGEDKIRLDEEELSLARWCTRDEIPENDGLSLTREMMQAFRENRLPEKVNN